ncbi:uroporphyrinogen decarboxylase family protein [Candidatus Poribacteria bacterium]
MNPKERVIAALELREPDDIVPTFELEFQLTAEFFGKGFKNLRDVSGKELDMNVGYNAEFFVEIAEALDYSIIRTGDTRILRKLVEMGADKEYLLCGEADGTMSIPNGENMVDLAVRLFDDADEVKRGLDVSVDRGIESGKVQIDAGAGCLTMCADYCFNHGPFLSPKMFSEFVTPYLHRLIEGHRENGAYVIKHTDGDIMPILDELVSCKPHALHSVDPQARVDLARVKELVGDKVCLAGNVNCGLLQTGTDEEVEADVIRSLRDGMPGGGYIFCTSNVAFKGMPPERYRMMLDLRQKYGRYN